MSSGEFSLIDRFFRPGTVARPDVVVGIGDDAAVLRVPDGHELVVSVDTLNEGVHFTADVAPGALGHKTLAVSLSDLAAMGAEPAWALLAVSLPTLDEAWIAAFMAGFSRLAGEHRVALVGGDTTRGPLALTVQIHGFVPFGRALRRDGAHPGDHVYVTGTLGDAALALRQRSSGRVGGGDVLARRLDRPTPRLLVGRALRGLASAAIDVSDGLIGDLAHILAASGVGARIDVDRIPRSAPFVEATAGWPVEEALSLALTGGDDYELCFTVPPDRLSDLDRVAADWDAPIRRIGRIVDGEGVTCRWRDGTSFEPAGTSFDHFASASRRPG